MAASLPNPWVALDPGTDPVARARALRPRLPVVVASGWAQSGDGYVALAKPYDSAGLRAAVDAALAG